MDTINQFDHNVALTTIRGTRPVDVLAATEQIRPIAEVFESYLNTPVIEGLQPGDIIQRRGTPQNLMVLLDTQAVERALADINALKELGFDESEVAIAFTPNGSCAPGTQGDTVVGLILADDAYMYRPDAKAGFDVTGFSVGNGG